MCSTMVPVGQIACDVQSAKEEKGLLSADMLFPVCRAAAVTVTF